MFLIMPVGLAVTPSLSFAKAEARLFDWPVILAKSRRMINSDKFSNPTARRLSPNLHASSKVFEQPANRQNNLRKIRIIQQKATQIESPFLIL